ncbi:MAG: isoamylase early set domain-containing protein [Caldilineaceae bacterium]
MIHKHPSSRPNHLRVEFELPASLWAHHVAVVADFNHWDPKITLMRQGRDGVWRASVELPICRRFEFRYWIDGEWATEQHADDMALNDCGSFNSVVVTDPIAVHPSVALSNRRGAAHPHVPMYGE